ncbi:MAG: polysaccharide pyruvyl transferase family protein [Cytophagales bacterium]|nr:polysaccharide pyruvyl transferase family protein [Armatimonadota bacterium]
MIRADEDKTKGQNVSVSLPHRESRLLLRSSWGTVNIGDIAHTPGILHLLEQYLPDTEVRLWPTSVGNGVEEMLHKRFPRLVILKSPGDIQTALKECDFLIHGSGPSLIAHRDVARWRTETGGKPYGIYGITLTDVSAQDAELIRGARFAFFRDSVSLKRVQDRGIGCPVLEFSPDAAFATDLHNDAAATAFLRANRLEEGKFLCVIPRLRYSPYWKMFHSAMSSEDERKHARSEAMKEHDHAPLRAVITAVTRQTPLKVLVCPEDESQMAVGKEMLVDPLPADVKEKVVWRERYWLTDEALSTYRRSAGLFGLEMHSPILCVGNGVPAIVCRFAEQTSKGFMWRDIGLGEWLFDMDKDEEFPRITEAVLTVAGNSGAAREKANRARDFVLRRFRETMGVVQREVLSAKAASPRTELK